MVYGADAWDNLLHRNLWCTGNGLAIDTVQHVTVYIGPRAYGSAMLILMFEININTQINTN